MEKEAYLTFEDHEDFRRTLEEVLQDRKEVHNHSASTKLVGWHRFWRNRYVWLLTNDNRKNIINSPQIKKINSLRFPHWILEKMTFDVVFPKLKSYVFILTLF